MMEEYRREEEMSCPQLRDREMTSEMTSDFDDVRFKYMKLDEIIIRCSKVTCTFLFSECRCRLGGQESRDVIGGGTVD